MTEVCATDPLNSEYTLCGNAFDGTLEDANDCPTFAEPGEIVTCSSCRRAIKEIRRYRYYRAPPAQTGLNDD